MRREADKLEIGGRLTCSGCGASRLLGDAFLAMLAQKLDTHQLYFSRLKPQFSCTSCGLRGSVEYRGRREEERLRHLGDDDKRATEEAEFLERIKVENDRLERNIAAHDAATGSMIEFGD